MDHGQEQETVPDVVRRALDDAHRREWAFVLSATVRVAGSLDLAEECTQDAYVRALEVWTRDGLPRNPGAWLTTTARNLATDRHRRAAVLRTKLPLLAGDARSAPPADIDETTADALEEEIPDDRLRLVFTCCHPALAREAQVALTLRLVCGLTTNEIAHAFLVSESTMAARVTRAKKKIAAARIPYRVPAGHELAERLDAVLTVLHLVLATGHTAPTGDLLQRVDLVDRAVDLTRALLGLMPDERELRALLGLALLGRARAVTRVDATGAFVPLEEQDRRRWDGALVAEGERLVRDSLRGGRPGRFALQAAIAALHTAAPSVDDTDWDEVVTVYDLLLRVWPSPVVELNRAIAVAFRDGPEAGLAELDALEDAHGTTLDRYHYLPATRADLLRRLGRTADARAAYEQALARCDSEPERVYLRRRLTELGLSQGRP
ncbi:putative ECF RNA polymerase sigma factor SigI [Nocardioides aquaticus]|uniref:ECF RNA polymerase sigma factor SigI n=1 Tax=Nocardioides aquaticus TaxID=160826 RepID=A0ABX8ENK1_9ACTN|nr:sigma-70 family RNA polymerase sigma factor [Nocardioides aquaticus]QVT80193.1 putative ECF RNA polymerase sigma factor SigI [Nocardioides aquaticus]